MEYSKKKRIRVDVLDLLSYYNLDIVIRGEEAQLKCPFHNDRDPSSSFNVITGQWTCYRCKIGGSPIEFVSRLEGWTPKKSDQWLRERYGGFFRPVSLRKEIERILEKVEGTTYPESSLEKFRKTTPYWTRQRGFTKELIERFELGYDERTNRGTIPIRDLNGKLVGVQGRAVNDNKDYAKYYYILNMRKNQHLFGLNLIEDSNYVVVVESFLAAIRLDGFGFNCVAAGGSSISLEQAQLLNSFDKVYMLFDNDEAGWLGMLGKPEKKNSQAAWNRINTKVYIPRSDDYDDIDTLTKTEVEDILKNSLNAQIHVPLARSRVFAKIVK